MTRFRIADDVAWVSLEDLDLDGVPSAYVAALPDGPPVTLAGPACVVWLALAESGTHEEITATAASIWGADVEAIRGDVVAVMEDLLSAGLAAPC
jgi:hypothetical protein